MELRKLKRVLVVLIVALALFAGQSSASFKDCYTKCFIFCMIDPSQTLCSCTTKCLKDCIFNSNNSYDHVNHEGKDYGDDNLQFCKLGCAFSQCSSLSTKRKPNGDKVDDCVGSCSTKCTKSYHSP